MSTLQERFPSLFVKENWKRKDSNCLIHIPTGDRFWCENITGPIDNCIFPKYLRHLESKEKEEMYSWLTSIVEHIARERYK